MRVSLALLFQPDHGLEQSLIKRLEQLQPLFSLPLQGGQHRGAAQFLEAGGSKQVRPFG